MKKNNKQIIFDYFADLMPESERAEFEKRLKFDTELSELFNSFSSRLNEIKALNDVEINDGYLNGLIPKVHQKLDTSKPVFKIPSLAYGISVIILTIISFIFVRNINESNSDFSLNSYTQLSDGTNVEINENYIDHFIYDDVTQYSEFYQNIDINENYLDSILNENSVDFTNFYDDLVAVDYDNYLVDLSTDEFNELYNSLKNK